MPDQSPDFDFCFKHIYMGLVIFLRKLLKITETRENDQVLVFNNMFHQMVLGKEWMLSCSQTISNSTSPRH